MKKDFQCWEFWNCFRPGEVVHFFTSWKCVLFPVDHSHNSISPRVELVTWSSFWILVEGNLGSFGALLLSVTFLLLNTTASFFLPGKPSACNFLSVWTPGRQMFAVRRVFTVTTFSVSVWTVWVDFGGACPPERWEQALLFLFGHKENNAF